MCFKAVVYLFYYVKGGDWKASKMSNLFVCLLFLTFFFNTFSTCVHSFDALSDDTQWK